MFSRKFIPEGIRITKVGLWYVLFAVIVGIAASNTGNNALYMVLAVMLAALAVSGVLSRYNLRGIGVELAPPGEVHANQPFHLRFSLSNRSRLFPRWLLLFSAARDGSPRLVPYLPRGGVSRGAVEVLPRRRGRHRIAFVHLWSIFPVGFFRKGMRYRVDLDYLAYPELFPAASSPHELAGRTGDEATGRIGWGHELHSLRSFRPGDDPRKIHWKQTARTGELIVLEREAEEGRRLSIVFDNAVGELRSEAAEMRFERLVSEAATAACDYLERGFEVELVTREGVVPFGGGLLQRLVILETLALVEPRAAAAEPLLSPGQRSRQLRLAMEAGR